jgi:hypothetical protein
MVMGLWIIGTPLTILKCQIRPLTILADKEKLYTLLIYFIYNNLVPHVYWQVFDFRNTNPQQERNVHKTQAKRTENPILR